MSTSSTGVTICPRCDKSTTTIVDYLCLTCRADMVGPASDKEATAITVDLGTLPPPAPYTPHRQGRCRCGSGRKYKKCCALREHEDLRLAREAERERLRNEPPRPMGKATRTALMAAALLAGGR